MPGEIGLNVSAASVKSGLNQPQLDAALAAKEQPAAKEERAAKVRENTLSKLQSVLNEAGIMAADAPMTLLFALHGDCLDLKCIDARMAGQIKSALPKLLEVLNGYSEIHNVVLGPDFLASTWNDALLGVPTIEQLFVPPGAGRELQNMTDLVARTAVVMMGHEPDPAADPTTARVRADSIAFGPLCATLNLVGLEGKEMLSLANKLLQSLKNQTLNLANAEAFMALDADTKGRVFQVLPQIAQQLQQFHGLLRIVVDKSDLPTLKKHAHEYKNADVELLASDGVVIDTVPPPGAAAVAKKEQRHPSFVIQEALQNANATVLTEGVRVALTRPREEAIARLKLDALQIKIWFGHSAHPAAQAKIQARQTTLTIFVRLIASAPGLGVEDKMEILAALRDPAMTTFKENPALAGFIVLGILKSTATAKEMHALLELIGVKPNDIIRARPAEFEFVKNEITQEQKVLAHIETLSNPRNKVKLCNFPDVSTREYAEARFLRVEPSAPPNHHGWVVCETGSKQEHEIVGQQQYVPPTGSIWEPSAHRRYYEFPARNLEAYRQK